MASNEYVVTVDAAGYRTEGNAVQYGRRDDVIRLTKDEAERLQALGAVIPKKDADEAREAGKPAVPSTATVDAEGAEKSEEQREAEERAPDPTTARTQPSEGLTLDRLVTMTVDQIKGYVNTHPTERKAVAELEKQRPDSDQRKSVVALGDDDSNDGK